MYVRHVGVAAVAAIALTVAGCSPRDSESSSQFAAGDADKPSPLTVVPPEDREPAPVLEGEGLDGRQVSSSDYDGQILVVNLWGSWCGPCREEAPALRTASQRLADEGVQFLGITTRSDPSQDRAFVEEYGLDYPSIQSPDGSVELGFTDSLPAAAVPTTWVIDAQGRVAVRVTDTVTVPMLVGLVDDVRTGATDG